MDQEFDSIKWQYDVSNPNARRGRFTLESTHVITANFDGYPVCGATGLMVSDDTQLNGRRRIGIQQSLLSLEPGEYDVLVTPAPQTRIIQALPVVPQ